MNKTEFIKAVAANTGFKRADVQEILEGAGTVIKQQVEAGGELQLLDLGKFKVDARPARQARNPATGDMVDVAAKTVVKFRPSKTLKDCAPAPSN